MKAHAIIFAAVLMPTIAVAATRHRDPLAYWDTPEYWQQNAMAKTVIVEACKHPERPGSRIYLRYCSVAQ